MLTAPKEKEELIMYLAAAKEAIRAVLMTKRDEKQMHIYFVSRILHGPKINYTPMEKLILALVSASKRLKRYFQAHTIIMITDQSIKQILSNPEVTGRLLKWSFEIEEHDIHYRPRTSVKGQILADFPVGSIQGDVHQDKPMKDERSTSGIHGLLFIYGRISCIDGSGAGLIVTNPEGVEFTYALRFRFDATNNEVEYEALIAGLWIAEQMGVNNLQANVESRLMANQVNGIYIAKKPGMIKYFRNGQCSYSAFKDSPLNIVLIHIRREQKSRCANNGETPFSLTYGTEAVILLEIGMPTLRTAEVDMIKNDKALEINLDLLEERREQAAIQEAKSKAKMEKYYNARVRNTSFRPGDLIYRNNEASRAEDGGKLRPK
ncbi:reverse transcriptase domain-containing protein [Tanacetum coccineum]